MERKIYLYTISNSYMNYLQAFDTRISLHNSAQGGVYVGTVLEISNDVSYFVPLTSYSKEKEEKMKHRNQLVLSLHELVNSDNKLGYMLFNNMIPVPKTELQLIDLSDQSIPKNRMMKLQQTYMRSILSGIENKSVVVYRKQIDGDPYYVKWCCDFTLLERRCIKFIESNYSQSQLIEKSDDLEMEI